VWLVSKQAWMRDSSDSIAMFGKSQAESLIGANPDMALKEVFICCAENLEDVGLPLVQQRWAERIREREALYGTDIARAAT
jgi:hypothetical protein